VLSPQSRRFNARVAPRRFLPYSPVLGEALLAFATGWGWAPNCGLTATAFLSRVCDRTEWYLPDCRIILLATVCAVFFISSPARTDLGQAPGRRADRHRFVLSALAFLSGLFCHGGGRSIGSTFSFLSQFSPFEGWFGADSLMAGRYLIGFAATLFRGREPAMSRDHQSPSPFLWPCSPAPRWRCVYFACCPWSGLVFLARSFSDCDRPRRFGLGPPSPRCSARPRSPSASGS